MASVNIGGITLSDWEIPEHINFGGAHMLTVHKLIGGARVVDTMGSDPAPVTWAGRFRGPTAMLRAQALDAMRAAGAQVPLFYLSTFVTVVISSLHLDPERSYEIPYRITCTVVADPLNDLLAAVVPALDSIVSDALSYAQGLL